jgi:hypothetical protein
VQSRCKFHEIHIAPPSPVATEAINPITALYAIEDEIRGSEPYLYAFRTVLMCNILPAHRPAFY